MQDSERPRTPKATAEEHRYFQTLGRQSAQLPPVSPPPPRTGVQVVEEMNRIARLAVPSDVDSQGDLDGHLTLIATFEAKAKRPIARAKACTR
ncbi:MAG: hypothetical protein OXH68_07945 [Gammaproteobacteria bacterium]|nr:hypothetical protein [Gammaproteobacteria bacterium]